MGVRSETPDVVCNRARSLCYASVVLLSNLESP